jgi:hypothetical protein
MSGGTPPPDKTPPGQPQRRAIDEEAVVLRTRAWVEHAVIGLNLCPFARAVQAREQIRYVVTEASDADSLLQALCDELQLLAAADPSTLETTLLIHPQAMTDFLEYNDFLDAADAAVEALGHDGVLQVASFHPSYQFDGTDADDVSNATNRSPYPTLHLLRESSIDRAVQAFGDTGQIYSDNIRTLQALGRHGWARLQSRFGAGEAAPATPPPGTPPPGTL